MMKKINKKVLDIWTERAKMIEENIGEKCSYELYKRIRKKECPYCNKFTKCYQCPVLLFSGNTCVGTPYYKFIKYLFYIFSSKNKRYKVTKKLFKLCNDEIDFLKKVIERDESSNTKSKN